VIFFKYILNLEGVVKAAKAFSAHLESMEVIVTFEKEG